MTRTRTLIATVLVAVVAVAGLSACSGGDEDAEPKAKETTTVPNTAPPVGVIKSTTVELSEKCAAAVQPVRDVMAKYKSGLAVADDADNQALSDGLAAGSAACDSDEWAKFQSDELLGWMNATP